MDFLFIILGLLPGFAWLVFFLKEDIHPEPKKMIFKVFVVGALFTIIALALEWFFQNFSAQLNIQSTSVFSFFGLSLIEEVFKFLAAYLVVRKSKFFDEPVDAMVYMVVAALGFATIENVAVVFNVISDGGGFGTVTGMMVLRFVGATLLHALSSGMAGYYWARKAILKGLVFATILHTIFNYLILIFNKEIIYSIVFLIIIAFFVFYDFEKLKGFVQKSEPKGE